MRQSPGTQPPARDGIAAAVLAGLWTLSFLGLRPTPLEGIDYVRFYEPYQHFLRERLLSGEIPWWNPYSSLGRPFAADLQTALLYPATLLVVALGPYLGWVIGTWVHGVLAVAGFRRLAGRFGASRPAAIAGAAAYLFCGPLYARMQEGEVNYVYALCLLPWVLWLSAGIAEAPTRRGWAALTLVFALQLGCGHPQVFWLSALGSGLFTTGLLGLPPWREALRRWVRTELALVAASLTAMALLGIVLVPFLELASQSNRARPSLAFSGAFSMSATQWMSLAWPTWGAYGVNWEYNLFVGAAVAAGGLVGLARLREPGMRAAAFMAACAAVIAAGPATPLFAVLFRVVPGMSSFRVPARSGILCAVALILGAAALASRRGLSRRTRGAAAAVAAALLLAAAVHAVLLPAGRPVVGWLCTTALIAAASGAAWWTWTGAENEATTSGRGARLALPLVATCAAALSVVGIKQAYRFDAVFPSEALVARAVGQAASFAPPRVCIDSDVFRENAGMVVHVASVVGYESLSLGRVWDYLHRASGADPGHAYSTIPDGHIFNAAGGLRAFGLAASLPLGASELRIERSPDPRAYLATAVEPVADARAAVQAMISGADFHRTALVESAYSGVFAPEAGKPAGTASIVRFAPDSLDIDVSSPGAAILVVAEAWYPGWTATVDGTRAPCVPVNDWMRGIPVAAGRSHVRLAFRQDGLLAGSLVSAAALLVLAAVWRGRPSSHAAAASPQRGGFGAP